MEGLKAGWVVGRGLCNQDAINPYGCCIKCQRQTDSELASSPQALEASGQLTGLLDDRGKYIYVSPEEMEAVAAFIKQRGRISIAELADQSGRLIDLEAKAAAIDAAAVEL